MIEPKIALAVSLADGLSGDPEKPAEARPLGSLRLAGLALAASAALVGITLGVGTTGYSTNDDVGMMRIASGAMTGECSGDLIYTNVLIGRLLALLYERSGTVNWYSVYVYGAHIAAVAGFLYSVLWHRRSLLAAAACLAVFAGLVARLLIQTQFTSAAVLAGGCGALWLLCADDGRGRRSFFGAAAGVVLIVLAALIRKEAFYLVLLIAGPFTFWEAWRRGSWRVAIAFLVAAGVGYGVVEYDRLAYARDPQWREFVEYNQTRARLHRFPEALVYEAEPQLFERIGWSPNDLAMFHMWFNADASVFSTENLAAVADRFSRGGANRANWRSFLTRELSKIAPYVGFSACMLLLCCWLATGNRVWFLGGAAMLVAPAAGVMVYLAVLGRLPPWVSLPVLCFVDCGVVVAAFALRNEGVASQRRRVKQLFGYAVDWECIVLLEAQPQADADTAPSRRGVARVGGRIDSHKWATVLLAVAFLAAGLGVGRDVWVQSAQNRRGREQWSLWVQWLKQWQASRGGRAVIVGRAGAVPFELLPPFSPRRNMLSPMLIPLGWSTHSPHYRALLDRHGIDDLHEALCDREDVYFLGFEPDFPVIAEFLREHYGREASASPVLKLGDAILVKFTCASP